MDSAKSPSVLVNSLNQCTTGTLLLMGLSLLEKSFRRKEYLFIILFTFLLLNLLIIEIIMKYMAPYKLNLVTKNTQKNF